MVRGFFMRNVLIASCLAASLANAATPFSPERAKNVTFGDDAGEQDREHGNPSGPFNDLPVTLG
jgi:hypothetical protein